ncbi:PAS domain S-box-containing protein/diguanylate cyclase (GGDEF)-like protein [Acholeplasma laidlawii]|nr:PAS domain S-box-containing protein/diguanylate cyclase (GGDEF)-like protein [Acholeplasma laidlawii]SQH56365.1 Diguanylate cyclase YdeH [Acholeplasma laidlawii]
MIILVILLVVFGLSIQILMINTHKRNILRKDYIALNVALYIDAFATMLFIFSVYFDAPTYFHLIFEYLIFVSMGILFLIIMRILSSKSEKRIIATFSIGIIGVGLIMIFGTKMDKVLAQSLLLVILLSRILIVDFRKVYPSKYIKSTVYLLFITETVRFITEGFITSDLLYHTFTDTWVSAFSFILRALSMVFIIILHDQLSINKNLAKTLDIQSSAKLLNQVFDQNPNVVILTNMKRQIIYANKQTINLTGYSEEELIGSTPSLLKSGLTPRKTYDELEKALRAGESWVGEFINRKKNGEIFTELSKIMTLKGVNGKPMFHLAIKNDITKEKAYLQELEYRSNHDDLTGLLRRQVFIQKLESNMGINHEHNHYFILMDIDEFKFINDNYGHLIGDDILIEFSSALKEVFDIRSYICRFGGDEFAVYLHDYEPEQVKLLIERLYQILSNHPIESISNEYRLRFSYGFTKIEIPVDFSKVYENSDKNLYEHKATKNNLRR